MILPVQFTGQQVPAAAEEGRGREQHVSLVSEPDELSLRKLLENAQSDLNSTL